MPCFDALDAGKRLTNASKAFSERQPAQPKAWASSDVGRLLARGRRPQMQGARALLADDKSGSRKCALRNSEGGEQRHSKCRQASLHVRAVRHRSLSAVCPPRLEGINGGDVGTDPQIAYYAGAWEDSPSCISAGRFAGFSGPEGTGSFRERGFPPEMVSERDLQARAVGRSGTCKSSSRAQDPKKMPARAAGPPADRRGGDCVP